MLELVKKAKKLMKTTGCTLNEAALALQQANEDYDKALAIILGKNNVNSENVSNSEPIESVNQVLDDSNVSIENVTFSVPKTLYTYPLIESIFFFITGIIGIVIYIGSFIEDVMEKYRTYVLILALSLLVSAIILIINATKAKKNIKNNLDDLKYIKSKVKNYPDNVIYSSYMFSKKDKNKAIELLNNKDFQAKIAILTKKHIGDGYVFGAFITSAISIMGWVAASMTFDPSKQEAFNKEQVIGVIIAFVFFITSIILISKLIRDKKITYRKFGLWMSIGTLVVGALVPLILYERYLSFLGYLIGYILAIFLVLGIIIFLFNKLFKNKSNPNRRSNNRQVYSSNSVSSAQPVEQQVKNVEPKKKTIIESVRGTYFSNNDGSCAGKIASDGYIVDNAGKITGKVHEDGIITNKAGEIVGQIKEDGSIINKAGSYTGKITESGYVVNKAGEVIGKGSK